MTFTYLTHYQYMLYIVPLYYISVLVSVSLPPSLLSLSPSLSLPPTFSGFTAIAAFLLTREVWNARAGLLAACFIAIVPGYISRSVAGSYDNEGIAIFALLFTYFLWLRSVKTGSVFWATAAAISYFYMVRPTYGYSCDSLWLSLYVYRYMGASN